MLSLSVALITLVSSVTFAHGSQRDLVQVEHARTPPSEWTRSRPADPSHVFNLSIAVDKSLHVEQALYGVSTPGHELYGKHLSQDEAQALLNPDGEARDAIMSWLLERGNMDPADVVSDNHWIRLQTTVRDADELLHADYAWFQHQGSGKEVLRTLRYSLPQDLKSKILLVTPTTRFCSHPMMHQTPAEPASPEGQAGQVDPTCNRTITPSCIRALYNVPANLAMSKARGLGVYASQSQVAKFADFALFAKMVDPPSTGVNFTFLSINGGTTDQNQNTLSNSELNFDVQYAASLSNPVPNVEISIAGDGPIKPEPGSQPGDTTEPWLIWLDAMLKLPDDQLPHTITTSFGENEQALPDGYAQQVCNQFGALGARGVSVLAASGDAGPGNTCVTNDGTNSTRFNAVFPASCPFVTGVGGVRGIAPERVADFSGGGFSDKFARPTYQENAAAGYLKNAVGARFTGLFNPAGRGFPDVSAQSFNLTFVTGGKLGGFRGTSASAPVWAGLVGSVNAALIQAGKPPMGFLNPWLYGAGVQAVNDVSVGESVGCTGLTDFGSVKLPPEALAKIVPNASWPAVAGWDAATGLGTPDMGKILALRMAG
ncbi:peptidase S8/S53 domain-containing protein [Colletotrichum cereale]|nr:peptidase S8/S53 domain-containing protein [Colletotrichum cereale]